MSNEIILKFLPQIIMTCLIVTYLVIYLVGICRGHVRPILATWLFFTLAALLSVITNYGETGTSGLIPNLYNIVDASATIIILVFVWFSKNTRRKFNAFENGCLVTVGVIGVGWLISHQNIIANLALQLILVIAYFPTIVHLWKNDKNTESLSMWFFDFSAATIGLFVTLQTMDLLPFVYALRAVISTFFVIVLILRLKYKKRNHSLLGIDIPHNN